MYRVRKLFKFEAAHVLEGAYSNECKYIHGHSYKLEVFLASHTLNSDGMVLDFKELKEIVQPYVDTLDHCLIIKDTKNIPLELDGYKFFEFGQNPTAENMAEWFYTFIEKNIRERYNAWVVLDKVRLWETETGYAEYYKKRGGE